jgi:hypothetical protein
MEQKPKDDKKIERWEDVPPVSNTSVLGELQSTGGGKVKESRLTTEEKNKREGYDVELYATPDGRITSGDPHEPLPIPGDWTSDDPTE